MTAMATTVAAPTVTTAMMVAATSQESGVELSSSSSHKPLAQHTSLQTATKTRTGAASCHAS